MAAQLRQPWRWLPFGLRLRLARIRMSLGRRRRLPRLVIVGSVLLFCVLLAREVSLLRAERLAWSQTVEVPVLIDDRHAGEVIANEHVATIVLPRRAVPSDVLESAAVTGYGEGDPSGVVHAAVELRSGDVLRQRDVVTAGAQVGTQAIALPPNIETPRLVVGDRIELYLFFDDFGVASGFTGDADGQFDDRSNSQSPSSITTVPAQVLAASEDGVVVTVTDDDAPKVVASVLDGRVMVAVAG